MVSHELYIKLVICAECWGCFFEILLDTPIFKPMVNNNKKYMFTDLSSQCVSILPIVKPGLYYLTIKECINVLLNLPYTKTFILSR